jgi:hypothetical protein
MKYAMVIMESDVEQREGQGEREREAEAEAEAEWRSEAERDFDALVRWWADLRARGKIVSSARLASTPVASVTWRGQQPILTDGPYVEAKESVAGFAILDVETEAEVRDIAASWPGRAGTRIELRCVVER